MAKRMVESVTTSLRSTLKQEGLPKAREQWQVLNHTYSTEEWWPPVARAVRALFDDFADEQARQKAAQPPAGAPVFINNAGGLAARTEFKTSVGQVDQLIGVAEAGSAVTYSTLKNTAT